MLGCEKTQLDGFKETADAFDADHSDDALDRPRCKLYLKKKNEPKSAEKSEV